MSIEIQAGKRYVMRYGGITGVMQPYMSGTDYVWFDGYSTFTNGGLFRLDMPDHSCGLVAEYTPPSPLGFELKSGEKYETVKPDGTPGPIIFDLEPRLVTDPPIVAARLQRMFRYIVLVGGEIVCADNSTDCAWNGCRIVRPYIPKPTAIERLEILVRRFREIRPITASELDSVDAIIADLKASVKP